jgi:Domain of unknown function (DUF397)
MYAACAMDAVDEGGRVDGTDREKLTWRKSSFCNSSSCVEVTGVESHILMRDSKVTNGPTLQFSLPEWHAFLNGVRDGEFDLA